MPKVLHANDGVRESVTRPVVFDIVRQIQRWTGLHDMPVIFPGDSEYALMPSSTIDNEPAFNNAPGRAVMRLSVKEDYQTDRLLSTAVHQQDYPEFFYDDRLMVFMRPVYSPTLLTLEFEYHSTDVNNARRWRDEIRTRISTNRDIRTHIVNYSYLVPKEFEPLLAHIHELREAQAGYGEDLDTYLANHFTQNVTKITNMGEQKGNERWAVVEQQGRIMGKFDWSEVPDEPQRAGDTSRYRQVFTYQVFYDCPIATAVDYPVLVHNQLIDDRYLMHQPKDDIQRFESHGSRSNTAIGAFEVDRMARPTIKSGLRLPEFHEFYPRTAPRKTLQVLSALVAVEEGNRTIMNFNEIDENWEFRQEFIDYMKYDHAWVHKYGESLINLVVYDNHTPLDHSMFSMDENLNVILNFDPDLRRTYYVRLALLMDPSELSKPAIDRARENAEGMILIGAALCPNLVKQGYLPQVLGDNYVGRKEAEKFFNRIRICTNTSTGPLADHAIVQWNTVMILFIETHDKNKMDE